MNLLSRLVIPAPVQAGWALLRPLLPYIAGALAILGAYLWIDHRGYQRGFHKRDPEVASLQSTIAGVRAKTAQAKADDLANKTRVETAQSTVTEKSNASLEAALADARARADDLTRRLRGASAADSGRGGSTAVPSPSDAASGAARSGQAPELASAASDNLACAEAVTKAQGWLDWWTEQARIAR